MDQFSFAGSLASAYASGSLDPALRLMLETQASLRSQTRAALDQADSMAGAFLEGEIPQALAPLALEAVLTRLEEAPAQPPLEESPQQRAARAASSVIDEILRLPRPVQDVALDALGAGGWTFAGPGLRVLKLPVGDQARTELLRIEPGWGAPRHSHRGPEFTLVLAGAFSDSRGRYGVGQIAVAGPDLTHSPVADAGEVCYALAVTEAPVELSGALGLLQRLWRH
jgi:putative transcriptional regulator